MSHDLAGALRRDVPEPPRTLDPDVIISTHRQRRQRRRAAVVAGTLALGAVGGSAAVLGTPDQEPLFPAAGPASVDISALGESVALPAEWTELHPSLPDRVSQVGTMDGDTGAYLWVDGDRLCLGILFGLSGDGPGGALPTDRDGCTSSDALLEEGLVLMADSSDPTRTRRYLVAVVPDGYTEATLGTQTAPVSNNAVVFAYDYLADVKSLSRSTGGILVEGAGQPTVTLQLP